MWITLGAIAGFWALGLYTDSGRNNYTADYAPIGYFALIYFITSLVISKIFAYDYCRNCRKRVYPLFMDHICEDKVPNLAAEDFKRTKDQIPLILNKISPIFQSDQEKQAFGANYDSLIGFIMMKDYKYSMIAMGSILEYLLEKYCKAKNILPDPFVDEKNQSHNGKDFANYLASAINKNILGEKLRWKLVQSHLRDFRNYVHIDKESKSDVIDVKWFETMKPVFEALIESFQRNLAP